MAKPKGKTLPLVLPFFKHVLDRGLVDHQIRSAVLPVHLEASPVVPFDDAAYFLAIAKNNHHRRPRLHLLLVIKILGIRLFGRRGLLPDAASHSTIPTVSSFHTFSALMSFRSFAPFRRLQIRGIVIVMILHPRQSRSDQLAVGERFLLR